METIIAEKLDAILYLMEASSRMKDYYDIYYLAISKNFDGNILKEAIHRTFENRGHLDFIKNIHEVSKFRELESLNNMWNRFMEKEIKISIEFNKVIDIILKLTIPICMAIENKEEYNKTWDFRELGYI